MPGTWNTKHKSLLTTSCARLAVLVSALASSSGSVFVEANSGDSDVVALTPENYDKLTANKIVFIKLYAPWCGHCQELAPKWEQLATEYADHNKYMIAEIDCTATPEAETWCDEMFGIEGFPTMLFGDPGRGGALLEEYLDEREYETLSAFAKQMFASPLCNVDHMDGCDDEVRAQLERYLRMPMEEIDEAIETIETEMDDIEEAYEESIDGLQDQYDELATNHQIQVSAISREMRWMIQIKESSETTATS